MSSLHAGALALLWMGESVSHTWQPSHDWWDAFLQRYATVLPEGVSMFGKSSCPGTHEFAAEGEAGADASVRNMGAESGDEAAAQRTVGASGMDGRSEGVQGGGESVEEEEEEEGGEGAGMQGEQMRGGRGVGEEEDEEERGSRGREKGEKRELEPWEVREARATAARLCRAL